MSSVDMEIDTLHSLLEQENLCPASSSDDSICMGVPQSGQVMDDLMLMLGSSIVYWELD